MKFASVCVSSQILQYRRNAQGKLEKDSWTIYRSLESVLNELSNEPLNSYTIFLDYDQMYKFSKNYVIAGV